MITVYQLKSRFQNLLRPLTTGLFNMKVTANMVTVAALIMSLILGVIIYLYLPKINLLYWLIPIVLFVRMALNAIDGMLAREFNQKSNVGAILNELGDIISDIFIYLPLLYVCSCNLWLIFLFVVLTIISETVGIMGVQINASRHYEGPMGKSDRAFWFGMLAIVLFFVPLSANILNIFTMVVSFFLVVTIFNRIFGALKEADNK